MEEDLLTFVRRISKHYTKNPDPFYAEMIVNNRSCPFCDVELDYFTSKKGNKYLANPDKSPHVGKNGCVNNWDEFRAKTQNFS